MKEGEKCRRFATRIRQLASTLKSMDVEVKDEDMAMALLCGLPKRFDSLISALDAVVHQKSSLSFAFVQSRLEQEEQRHADKDDEVAMKSEEAALGTYLKKKERCVHCGKHQDSSKCYFKFPLSGAGGAPRTSQSEIYAIPTGPR